jgi:hypothetical protein
MGSGGAWSMRLKGDAAITVMLGLLFRTFTALRGGAISSLFSLRLI